MNKFKIVLMGILIAFASESMAENGMLTANELRACYRHTPRPQICTVYLAGVRDGIMAGVNLKWNQERSDGVSIDLMMSMLSSIMDKEPRIGPLPAYAMIGVALIQFGYVTQRHEIMKK